MQLRDIRKVTVKNKRVLVRVDYNIELNAGRVRDITRIQATLPTLQWLLQHEAIVILVAHRGRPHGRQPALSLRPYLAPLRRLLRRPVVFLAAPLGSTQTKQAIARLQSGQVALLENIRFEAGEENDSPTLARRLAALCDIYVNDGFAVSHRAAASVVGIARCRPAYAGLLMQKEVRALSDLRWTPKRPYVAIIGGAKISTKLGLVKKLLKKADHVLLGGALANTVLQAEGLAVGASLTEPKMLKAAKGLTVLNRHLHIPCDVRVTTTKPTGNRSTLPSAIRAVGNISPKEIIVDIGPDTVDLFRRILNRAATIVWNGPVGWYEVRPFDAGTRAIARVVAGSKAFNVAGGGETIDAIRSQGLTKKFNFISTGGGAMLEFLEGKILPGVRAVSSKS